MHTWLLEESEVPLAQMRKQESILAQGNGYFGWRGSFEEGLAQNSLEGCYLNGFYEEYSVKYPEIAYGYPDTGQSMLNVMNPKYLRLRIDGEAVDMASPSVSGYRRTLDIRSGLLERSFVYTSQKGGRVRATYRRIISFPHKHRGALRLELEALGGAPQIALCSGLDTRVHNQSAGDDPRVGTHLPENCFAPLSAGRQDALLYAAQRTLRSGLAIACAAHHRADAEWRYREQDGLYMLETEFALPPGKPFALDKIVAYHAKDEPEKLKQRAMEEAEGSEDFAALLRQNEAFLAEYWEMGDFQVEGDALLQQGLRFNSFHILQSVGRDGSSNIAAKGLTGEGYEGHYFWDTEMFVLPSLLYSQPEISRNLLVFRYHLLDAARKRAREMGHRKGALYPWRTIGGRECSTFFPAGTAQYHINGDIAYAVKQYMRATDDFDFLREYGAEILFETARIWLDMGHFNARRGGEFCIDDVTGPDEYTAIVNNNFYTNRIARENLWYACEAYARLTKEAPEAFERLRGKIALSPDEMRAWQKAADNMFFPYDEERGVFLQDDSFADKADWDFEGTREDQYPLLLHFHPLTIYRHRVLKQADTVFADLLFDEYIDEAQIRRDYDYYEPLTTHDSSLSACVYSMVACRIGYLGKAYDYFLRAARTDLDDHKGNTKDGVHIANMAGTALCMLQGFAGLRVYGERLALRPVIPEKWTSYALPIAFRGRKLLLCVNHQAIKLTLREGARLALTCHEKEISLEEGETVSLPLHQEGIV